MKETLARFFLLKKSLLLCLLFLNPFSVRIDTEKGPRFQSEIQRNASPFSPLQNDDVYTTYTTLTMSTRQRALSAQPKTPHTEDDEEKEEDDDNMNTNATNNWLHLVDDRKDREKIIRLQNADDPSLRAMFEAIRVTMKKKDDNMERAAMIGFERGVSFGVAEGGGGKTKTIKKKKKKENDSDEDEEFAISEGTVLPILKKKKKIHPRTKTRTKTKTEIRSSEGRKLRAARRVRCS